MKNSVNDYVKTVFLLGLMRSIKKNIAELKRVISEYVYIKGKCAITKNKTTFDQRPTNIDINNYRLLYSLKQ